jgi:RHS repeat-associated protein
MDRNLTGGSTATAPGDQRLFYYYDATGSVYALTDTSAKILEAYQYDAYGRQTVFDPGPSGAVVFGPADIVHVAGSSALGNPFLFAGMRLESETGLYYAGARFYDSQKGRFLQRDPLSYVAGSNWYSYAKDNPTNLVDPFGLAAVPSEDLINLYEYLIKTGWSKELAKKFVAGVQSGESGAPQILLEARRWAELKKAGMAYSAEAETTAARAAAADATAAPAVEAEAKAALRLGSRLRGAGIAVVGVAVVVYEAPQAGRVVEQWTGSKKAGAATAAVGGAAGGTLAIVGTAAAIGSVVPVAGTIAGAAVGAAIATAIYLWW